MHQTVGMTRTCIASGSRCPDLSLYVLRHGERSHTPTRAVDASDSAVISACFSSLRALSVLSFLAHRDAILPAQTFMLRSRRR
jgi:hypothetical protein